MKGSVGEDLFSGAKANQGHGRSEGGSHGGPDSGTGSAPLADRIRPRSLDEFVGQDHIIGPGRLLRRAIQKDQLSSIIFSGPPGTGKTTLARIIANTTSRRFVTLNAVLAGVADIRVAIEDARRQRDLYDRSTILFVDEVHRWNKSQQDALLPWVENGTIILIGATTENPFFEVNRALVSRSRVFLLKPLEKEDLEKAARFAVADKERGYGRWEVRFGEGALEHLVGMADGDARSLLNALELAVETSVPSWPPEEGSTIDVNLAAAEESIQRRAVLYDKDGDFHYDAASAFIKSIRGSDPDAALYWLARMVYAGEDPRFMFRRMLISASEDIGLADPAAIGVVSGCAQAFDRIGMPEGQFHLAEAALYLATCPKSNSALGYYDALKAVEEESAEVPNHLKDASRDAKGFGHGEGYAYPHAYRDHWVAQQYLPESMKNRVFYNPGELGVEGQRKIEVLGRRETQLAGIAEIADFSRSGEGGNEVWSRSGESLAEWTLRSEASAGIRLSTLRTTLFDAATPGRADRVLVFDARDGYLVWEARRRSPEGTVVALVQSESEARSLEDRAAGLGVLEKPLAVVADFLATPTGPDFGSSTSGIGEIADTLAATLGREAGFSQFDLVLGSELASRFGNPAAVISLLAKTLPGTAFAAIEQSACEKARLSVILAEYPEAQAGEPAHRDRDLLSRYAAFEREFFSGPAARSRARSAQELSALYDCPSISGLTGKEHVFSYPRRFSKLDVRTWFGADSIYGKAVRESLGEEATGILAAMVLSMQTPVDWPFSAVVFRGRLAAAR